MLDTVKDQMLHVRIDDRDRERLDRLAKHHEMTAGAVVRMLIRQAVDALPVAAEPPKRAKK